MLGKHHIEKLDRAITILEGFELWSTEDPRAEGMFALKDLREELKDLREELNAIASFGQVKAASVSTPGTLEPKSLDFTRKRDRRRNTPNPEFERFWAAVRMKVGKAQARRAFDLMDEDIEVDYLIQKLEECQNYFLKRHGHLDFMPRPYTWLAMKRWEDEWGE